MIDPKAEQAAQIFEKTWGSWRSIELDTHTERQYDFPLKALPDPFLSDDLHYVETVLGQRLFDQTLKHADGRSMRHTGYCDSQRNALVLYQPGDASKQSQITISHTFLNEQRPGLSTRPIPFVYNYVGSVPLNEALRSADVKFNGHEEILGHPCHVFRLPDIPWNQGKNPIVYHIDSATGTPLAVEIFIDEAHYQQKRPLISWKALSLKVVERRLFADTSEEKTFLDNVAGGLKPECVLTHTVVRVRFDEDYPRSTFWPGEQSGAEVFDSLKRKHYFVGGRKPAPRTEVATTKSLSPPIRVAEDASTRFSGWPAAATGLGLGTLLIALLVWRRKHRSARWKGAD
jgi:hypothetical protein